MHTCLPNQNAKTFDRANKEGGYRGVGEREERGAGEGRKGGGRMEKGGEKGEKEEGLGRTGGREKGWRRREKGTPLYPSQQAYHKEWPYVILRGKDLRSTTSYVNMTSSVQE